MLRPTNCPKCDSKKVKKILYGLLCLPIWKRLFHRDWICGGCCIDEDSPEWYCDKCEYGWGKYQK